MSPLPRWILFGLSAQAVACGDADRDVSPRTPTLVALSPESFLGQVPCAQQPGGMRRYVATLVDITPRLTEAAPELQRFTLPSSGPTSCQRTVAFERLVVGHRYIAEVFGYDRTDLQPLALGSPTLVDAETGAFVPPRWTTACGQQHNSPATAPATAVEFRTVQLRGCQPLQQPEMGRSGLTGLSVDLAAALGELQCGDEAGRVSRYRTVLRGTELPAKEAACDTPVQFVALQPGTTYVAQVAAFEQGASVPRWGTRCTRTAVSGTLMQSSCEPLSEQGALALDIPALLADAGTECGGEGVVELEATLQTTDEPIKKRLTPPQCERVLRFDELPGSTVHRVDVTTTAADGSSGPSAACEALVLPADVVRADCTVDGSGS